MSCLFYQGRGGFVNDSVVWTKYCPSPIPYGGLEILGKEKLCWKTLCLEKKKFEKMKNFVDSLCDYDYSSVKDKKCSNEEAAIVIETDMSVPVSYTVIN